MQFRYTRTRKKNEQLPDGVALFLRKRRLLKHLIPIFLLLALVLLFLAMNQSTGGGGSSASMASGSASSGSGSAAGASGSRLSVLSSTQSVSLALAHTTTKAFDASLMLMGSKSARYPLQAVRVKVDICDPTLALKDQPTQNCTWSNGTPATLTCMPTDDTAWPTAGAAWPALLTYTCNTSTNGTQTLYCNVPTYQPLQNVTIQCTTTKGRAVDACAYTYLNIDACNPDPTCDNIVLSQNPLTGLPSSIPMANGVPIVCPVTTQTCLVVKAVAPGATDWLFGSTNGLLIATRSADTYGNALVQQLRTFSFALALALLALPFCLVGFQLLRGVSGSGRANASELFSRIVLALVTVIASFYLIQACIDLESAIVNTLFTNIPAPAVATFMPSTNNNWECYIHQFFGSIFNLSAYSDQHSANIIDTPTYLSDANKTTITIMSNLNYYIMTLLSVLLAMQLAVRLALLNAYIIVSPLTIISSALGQGGADITHAWIKGFGSLLCVQILQLLVLWVGIQFIPSAWLSGGSTPDPGWVIDLFTKILPITLLGLTLSVPRLLQNPATTVLATVSSSIGGAMTGVILIIRGV